MKKKDYLSWYTFFEKRDHRICLLVNNHKWLNQPCELWTCMRSVILAIITNTNVKVCVNYCFFFFTCIGSFFEDKSLRNRISRPKGDLFKIFLILIAKEPGKKKNGRFTICSAVSKELIPPAITG